MNVIIMPVARGWPRSPRALRRRGHNAPVIQAIGTAVAVFAGTNVDDIILLTVLFLASRAGGVPRPWQIVAGQ